MINRDAILAELLEIESLLQDDRPTRIGMRSTAHSRALRKIFEPDIWHQASQTLPHRQPAKRGRFPASSLDNPAAKEIMTPLTSAQCLAIAVRKIGEATGDRRYGKELEATARAWLVLAERIEQGERLALQDSQCGQEKAQSDVCNLTLNV
jgi:hypothetical protein